MPRMAKINNIVKESITEEEVNQVLNAWDFLEFSNTYRNQVYSNSFLTPDSINRRMKDVNMNPVSTTIEGLENALKNPKDNEQILRNYATNIEIQNMFYKRLIRYNSDMMCFNLTFDVINAEKDSEFKSKEFKSDLKILENFCDKFDIKQNFQTVVRQIIRQGVYYCILRDEGEKYVLQELPPDYCIITGRHEYGLLFDFNMDWFMDANGVDINMYPKIFKKMLRDIYSKRVNKYKASGNVDRRNSVFVKWHQCSPSDGFWAWKLTPELATIVPYYSALFPEMAMQPTVRNLQEDKYFIEASKLLVGIIGTNKDNKSGNTNNQIKMTPEILGKFLGVARQGLAKQIGLTALPMEDVKAVEFDTKERNMLTEYIKNITDQSASSSASLLDDNKLTVHQSKLASAIDENFVTSMYSMFADFIEFFVNKQTSKYKFKIKLNDVNTPDNRAYRQGRFTDMAQLGFVDFQEAARVYDLNPFELNRRLSISSSMGFDKKLINIASILSPNDEKKSDELIKNGRGRPKKENSDNESTQNSIARGSNDVKEFE